MPVKVKPFDFFHTLSVIAVNVSCAVALHSIDS